ncbi:MAG: GTP-binding protein [Oscillospiraceae bacterium]|nr:GTP-binding protein [Oscillospiraceae bacterium]
MSKVTKVDVFSGFLGAGKTTLIKKLLSEVYTGEKLVLIENEFGEISVDGGFLKESGIEISEMSSGCICCSLVGDFGKALADVKAQFDPDRILIEPSGVGKLSDVVEAVRGVAERTEGLALGARVTVADASKVRIYMKNFGEFYNDQIENAGTIVLSRTQNLSDEKLAASVALLREKNESAAIITTPWEQLGGAQITAAMEKASLADELFAEHLHHHEHDEHCACGCHEHHNEHGEHCHHDHEHGEHCHHEHDHGEHCHHHEHDHEHAHHHDHGEHCTCGCHDHDHHHHHADEVFASWGRETTKRFSREELENILCALDGGEYGAILRAKGIVCAPEGTWLHFDFVPEEHEVREGTADYTGRLCVIGAELREEKLGELFGV